MQILQYTISLPILILFVTSTLCALVAYVWGRGRTLAGKSKRFERIGTHLRLNNTRWQVTYREHDHLGNAWEKQASFIIRQIGSRLVGEGEDELGRRWSFEGTTIGNRISYIYLDRAGRAHRVGSVMAEMNTGCNQLVGLRSSWSQDGMSLSVQPITLDRMFATPEPTTVEADSVSDHLED